MFLDALVYGIGGGMVFRIVYFLIDGHALWGNFQLVALKDTDG